MSGKADDNRSGGGSLSAHRDGRRCKKAPPGEANGGIEKEDKGGERAGNTEGREGESPDDCARMHRSAFNSASWDPAPATQGSLKAVESVGDRSLVDLMRVCDALGLRKVDGWLGVRL